MSRPCPADLQVKEFADQSLFVRAAISGVVKEGVIAAALTALMILLFLGSWRSTFIIALSIPLAVLCSIAVLSALGETINLMTLGGLALAVGILVDDATVTIENIHRHMAPGEPLQDAVLEGAQEIALPALCLDALHLHRVCADVFSDGRRRVTCSCRWRKPWCLRCWPATSFRERSCRRW